ncbi:hypothetical protein RJT34_03722 [Clitoria ternatea]|uniref:Cystatin domain-containing protein n=1 Tax=Clitoria ternatea TaxID=43366 RepID=A0AAN9KMM8_CLITE
MRKEKRRKTSVKALESHAKGISNVAVPRVAITTLPNFPNVTCPNTLIHSPLHKYAQLLPTGSMAPAVVTVTLTILTILASVVCTASYGGLVGGKTVIAEVKKNKEVQELGRFAVEEYNRNVKEEEVKFVEVVEAEQQVVSGIKYYMKISATESDGDSRMFDSVVVVKPWLPSKQLLNFAPSA